MKGGVHVRRCSASSNGSDETGGEAVCAYQEKDVLVVTDKTLYDLFPKREKEAFADLKLSIRMNGQEGKCLYCHLDDKLLIIDGFDTSRVMAELRKEGHPIEVAWELYTPKATTREALFLELMAVIIRRKMIQTAVEVDEDTKEGAIKTYLTNCYAQAFFPTSRWVAEDLGCSGTYVGRIRDEMIKEGLLPEVPEYRTRNGKPWPAITQREVFNKTSPVAVTSSVPVKTDEELIAEEEATKAKDAATAARTEEILAATQSLVKGMENPPLPPASTPEEMERLKARLGKPQAAKETPKQPPPTVPFPTPATPEPSEPVSEEEEVRGQDEDETDETESLRETHLHCLADWDDDIVPREDREWFYEGGFLEVNTVDDGAEPPAQVYLVNKDRFITLLASKFAPIVKKLGFDPVAFEAAITGVFNPVDAPSQEEPKTSKKEPTK